MSAAKDVLRVNRGRLIRLWINSSSVKGKAVWVEMGHFFSGFDFKLARIRETDGKGRDRPCMYRSQGTFEPAQNEIVDYQNHIFLLNGVRGVAMLVGKAQWPDQGKLLIFDWNGSDDERISIIADPSYAGNMMKASGNISGAIRGFQMYRVTGLSFANGALNYHKAETLFTEGVKAPDFGNNF